MTPNPILLFVWAALAICFFALLMYRGQLTRYEDEQLFLNEDTNRVEQEQQTQIVRRVRSPIRIGWRRRLAAIPVGPIAC